MEGTIAIPKDIEVAQTSSAPRDLSKVQEDAPAGIELDECFIHGSRACARQSNLVHVLQLQPSSSH